VNKYQIAKARIAGGSKSFDPLFFKDVADEAEIDSKMTKVYTTKPDDKVIVMVDVEQVLRQNP
jgi:hypothetical protein